MKKTFLFLAAMVAFGMNASAQQEQIEDGSFDFWKEETDARGEKFHDLSDPFWGTLNMLATLPAEQFTGPVTVFRDKGRTGADDDYAPRMQSDTMTYGQDAETIFLPGVVGAMTVITETQTAQFGRPFSSRPLSLKGYMKYTPVNGDSASIFVELYKYNEVIGERQIIGKVEKIFHEAINDWTEFELDIKYNSDVEPDSVTVLFVSSAGYDFDNLFKCKGQTGSKLWVDDVQFVYEDGTSVVELNEMVAAKAYPNPSATGEFNVLVPAACRAQVVSISGQVVMNCEFQKAGQYAINLGQYAPGVYMLRLQGERGTSVLKLVRK